MEFFGILEAETWYTVWWLEDIRMGKEAKPTYEAVSIPKIYKGYSIFKKDATKKAKTAKKAAAATAAAKEA